MTMQWSSDRAEVKTQPAWSIYMLGPPRIELGGTPVHIARSQVRALLFYLASEQRPVSREMLCFLFWPNQPEASSRRKLSHVLSHLRKSMHEHPIVDTSNGYVCLEPGSVTTDLVEFEHLAAISEVNHSVLERCVELYAGPFLAGFSLDNSPEFDYWFQQKQQELERKYLKTLGDLIDHLATTLASERAIRLCHRYLEIDELAENIHSQLIELYGKIGDRGAAKRQYTYCAEILARELGVEPLPTTQAVFQAVNHGAVLQKTPPIRQPQWSVLSSLDAPFIGRKDVFTVLDRAYAQAREGNPIVLLLSGEAGIGKTRTIQQFAGRLNNGTLLLSGTCLPGIQSVPYRPITEALRPVLEVMPNLLTIEPSCLAQVSRLIPELRLRKPDLPPLQDADPAEAIACLFDALCHAFLELVIANPMTVLFIDDLHWADHVTLGWLTYLIKQLKGRRILFIGTYCCQALGDLAEFRYQMMHLNVLQEYALNGLDRDEITLLKRQVLGPTYAMRQLSAQLQQVTGGNPYFLLEIIRFCQENAISLEEFLAKPVLEVPETVRKTVDMCVGRLSPVGRQILEAASSIGFYFDFPALLATAGRSELEVLDGLDELVRRHLLTEADGRYYFRHEVARLAVQSGMSVTRQDLLRQRAQDALG